MDKLYICRNCSYVFPKGLSKLIDDRTQVYCEMCGTPFSLSGVNFKQPPTRRQGNKIRPHPKYGTSDKNRTNLEKAIEILNKFDYIPIIFYMIIVLVSSFSYFRTSGGIVYVIIHGIHLLCCALILIYDLRHISPRVQSKNYDEIALDAMCYGILGSITGGAGVILLIKGVLILIHSIVYDEGEDHKIYNYGLKLKNSINNFSAKAGFVITLIVLNDMITDGLLSFVLSNVFLFIMNLSIIIAPIIILIIDLSLREKIHKKNEFSGLFIVGIFIMGATSTAFLSIGIFILIKSLILLLLFIGKPIQPTIKKSVGEFAIKSDYSQKVQVKEKKDAQEVEEKILKTENEINSREQEIIEEKLEKEHLIEKPEEIKSLDEQKEEEVEIKTFEIEKNEEAKEEEEKSSELRLHESLLPVKNQKDKKLVKEYFSKIFNVLSKDLRKQISQLDIPKKERKNILKELAFLAEEQQIKYFEALQRLYAEIPYKLIERIRKLPNLKPKYHDKLVEELKYMDSEQQLEFVQFLEKNA